MICYLGGYHLGEYFIYSMLNLGAMDLRGPVVVVNKYRALAMGPE